MDGDTCSEWRVWPRDDRYEVSSTGEVRSYARPGNQSSNKRLESPHVLKPTTSCWGYKVVWVGKPHKTYIPVHRMMLESFVGIPEIKMHCLHKNDVRTDNSIGNLRWGTHKDNMADRSENGKTARGERSANTTLTEMDVIEIRHLKETAGATKRAIALLYDISPASVKDICSRRSWGHV